MIGKRVQVEVTSTADTYYGRLASCDDGFVVLTNVVWGRWGEAGWWYHGLNDDEVALPSATVRSIRPSEGP